MVTSNQLVGLGLRPQHYEYVLEKNPDVGWFEVHSENFFFPQSPPRFYLKQIRRNYPISLHGIGLSLGSADLPCKAHLTQLKALIQEVDPFLISEHLSWSRVGATYLPDLLPVPYIEETLNIFCRNVSYAQDYLEREILIENPSSYIEYEDSDFDEAEFLSVLCQNTGAKILLDLNNIFISCQNHEWSTKKYLEKIPKHLVKEIHLAGHSEKILSSGEKIKIDTHDEPICDEVWHLFEAFMLGADLKFTLLEWDSKIPAFEFLMKETEKIKTILGKSINVA